MGFVFNNPKWLLNRKSLAGQHVVKGRYLDGNQEDFLNDDTCPGVLKVI